MLYVHVFTVLLSTSLGEDVEVVALGTGSKCIGQSKMNKEGQSVFHLENFPRGAIFWIGQSRGIMNGG